MTETTETLDPNEERALLRDHLKAFLDPERLQLIGVLAEGEHSLVALTERFGMRVQRQIEHFSRLNLLKSVQRNGVPHYSLNKRALLDLNKRLFGGARAASQRVLEGSAAWERQVLQNFFEGERLKTIPAQRKQFLVVLKWMAARFLPNERYPERMVNEIIARHHPDYATFRRALVDEGLMTRQEGIYWRVTPERPNTFER
jgi:hypothetical protein